MSYWQTFRHEFTAIFSNSTLLLTVFGGVVFYSFLYPLPYAKQVPREQQVVVVNLDGSQMSRELERMIDATPQVQLARRAYSLKEAEEIFVTERMSGIIVIPEHFYRDLLLGASPTLSYAGDASYFLIYGTVLEGLAGAGKTLASRVKVNRLVMSGQALSLASEQYSAVKLQIRAVFNPTTGYVNYVIPAIFVLILHHTLVMGAGILGGGQNEARLKGQSGYWQQVPVLQLVVIRAGLFVGIYWLLCMYYFGFSFNFYNIPHHAKFFELNLIILPFLLGTSLCGIFLGLIIPRRELATLIVLLSSMPLIFASGFVWPVETVPDILTAIIQFIPVVPAIKIFLGINQMGAELSDYSATLRHMWVCVALYGTLSLLTLFLQRKGASS